MERTMNIVEKIILYTLMILMALVLILATVDLILTVFRQLSTEPILVMTLERLLEVFGMFLLVLVGLELLDTVKAYLKENVVHAEIVILAALIAISRKAITLDFENIEPPITFSIAALVIALAVGYYLLKHSGFPRHEKEILSPPEQ